jgi:hypothetical protein
MLAQEVLVPGGEGMPAGFDSPVRLEEYRYPDNDKWRFRCRANENVLMLNEEGNKLCQTTG